MTDKKKEGQYMTPDGIVSMILNNIGYTENHVLTRKIMEPSFGDGAFLINIVQRIISEGTRTGLSKQQKDLTAFLLYMIYQKYNGRKI